jgi:hypothetical protein
MRARSLLGTVSCLLATTACTTPVAPPTEREPAAPAPERELGAPATARTPVASATDAREAALEIPFEISSNKPWVGVRVNGSDPQWFILDTGCRDTSIIARQCAERLHLPIGGSTPADGGGAGEGVKVEIASTPRVTLGVGGDSLESPGLPVFSFAHVEPYEGRRLDGLLGEDFLRRHVVELDYARRVLRVHDPENYVHSGASAPIPITFHDGLAVVSASMTPPGSEEIPCHVVIDTGVRTTTVWYRPFVIAHDLVASQPHVVTGTIGGGVSGETKGDIGRLDRMTIGSLVVPHPSVVFSRDSSGVFAGSDEDGIVGGAILRRCKVTFDYPHERLYLEPYPGEFAAFDDDMSGMFLVSSGPDFRRVTIQSVAERTPASEAGIAKGDELVSIDGRPVAERTLDEVRELFKRDGASYRVAVKHGDESREVRLTLKRLV